MAEDVDKRIDNILQDEPVSGNIPNGLWESIHGTWTGLWTSWNGEWDELAASDVFAINEFLSPEREQWLKKQIEALIAEREKAARIDELKHVFHVSHENLGTTIGDPKEGYMWISERIAELNQPQDKETK